MNLRTKLIAGCACGLAVGGVSAQSARADLIHRYSFSETSGTTVNDSVGSANGVLHNADFSTAGNGSQLSLSNSGLTGNSATEQYVSLPSNVLPSSGSTTIEAWFTESSIAQNWSRVFDFGSQSGTSGQTYVFFTANNGGNQARGVITNSAGSGEKVVSTTTKNDNTQHAVAVVIDAGGGLIHLYIDGSQIGTGTALSGTSLAGVNDALNYLGRSLYNADSGYTGSLNEFRIYNDALSSTQVGAEFTAGPDVVAAPEPASLGLLAVGALGLLRRRRLIDKA